MAPSKSKKATSLRSGRPPTSRNYQKSLNSKATQKTIVTFHQLNKDLAKARSEKAGADVVAIEARIKDLGGLKAYQAASILGQASFRGGDSSFVLVGWIRGGEAGVHEGGSENLRRLRLLEIGALSTKNACSRCGLFDQVVRIDLHSQEVGILKQDFMERLIPESEEARFEVLSLSLVLNFVPEPKGRGEMLRRTTEFFTRRDDGIRLLFLVLPAPCVLNSRYFDEGRLKDIMGSLGYAVVKRKQSKKLVYWLWEWKGRVEGSNEQVFGKVKVRDGPGMNNFCIELRSEGVSDV